MAFTEHLSYIKFFSGSDGKETPCNAGDLGLIPGSERFPEEGNGNPLQNSNLENSTDRRARTEELQSMESQELRHDRVTNTFTLSYVKLYILYVLYMQI